MLVEERPKILENPSNGPQAAASPFLDIEENPDPNVSSSRVPGVNADIALWVDAVETETSTESAVKLLQSLPSAKLNIKIPQLDYKSWLAPSNMLIDMKKDKDFM